MHLAVKHTNRAVLHPTCAESLDAVAGELYSADEVSEFNSWAGLGCTGWVEQSNLALLHEIYIRSRHSLPQRLCQQRVLLMRV